MCRYVNGSLSWFRRGRSEPRGDLSGVEATDGDVVACVDAREGLLQVERLLSPRQRRVLRNLFGGKSTRDMARELRVSPQSVRRTVTRVRNRFCTRLLAWGAA
jgi:DNA-binding NarL/FixJ family response regulator